MSLERCELEARVKEFKAVASASKPKPRSALLVGTAAVIRDHGKRVRRGV
jgi:hypothetical protein